MKLNPMILIVLVAILFVGSMSVFVVDEREKVIVFRLGEIVRTDLEPGLHFKFPFINNVRKYDGRIQTLDSNPERFLTSEKKNVIVDTFVKWKISNVNVFYRAVGGDPRQVDTRLNQFVKEGMRAAFSKQTIKELISVGRDKIRIGLVKDINLLGKGLGIDIVDVRIKRIDLPDEVSASVYKRMESERERVARDFRSRGKEAAERIKANADKQGEIILATAYKESQILRGTGDAEAAKTYADAYNKNKEFFAFYRSLDAYRKSMGSGNDLIVLEPTSDFFKYFKKSK
ncbi:MAG TPA: protease modulator HflC [Cycloclasticus sp.]|jgi:membrane protease subunit HflC|nr:protease modulator HflC [Cycloclasticus sp.]HIL91472.1 protease modulator HflC [Cycloclasticus sp.]